MSMSAHAAHTGPAAPEVASSDDLLAALERAPVVPFTEEERALLAEMEAQPTRWIPHETFAADLDQRRGR
jgi:hypothetical protein